MTRSTGRYAPWQFVRVLMFGDRNWLNVDAVNEVLDILLHKYPADHILVIVGGADGADTIAEEEAKKRGIHAARVDALWDVLKRAAGPVRNGVMLNALDPHFGFAFHENLNESRGTADMARQMGRARKKVWLHDGQSLTALYS